MLNRLIIWEDTEEFKQEFKQASEKLSELRRKLDQRKFQCTFLGYLSPNIDGYFDVMLNDCMPYCARSGKTTPDQALQYALIYGAGGRWTLEELDQFVAGEGLILEAAMCKLGYRKHKKDNTKWARKTGKDKQKRTLSLPTREIAIESISGEELDRLNQLWALPNEYAGLDRTYKILGGTRGMIYVGLMGNPFVGSTAETLWQLSEQARDRGHFARQQPGFQIETKNVRLRDQEGVYIKAVKPDESYSECIWPTTTPREKLDYLVEELFSRIS